MPYAARDDWSGDLGRITFEVHYRLYVSPNGNQAAVICAQDHDYLDYDARRILSPEVYETEAEAEGALIGILPIVGRAEASLPSALDPDIRARMFASIVRDELAEPEDRVVRG